MYYYAMTIVSVISWPFARLIFIKELIERKIGTALDKIPSWIKPDHFCYARMALSIPVNYFIFWRPIYALALFFYLLACITDFLDGALARRRNEYSKYGASLDPTADKVLNGSIFGCYLWFICEEGWFLRQIIRIALVIDGITFFAAAAFFFLGKKRVSANPYGKLKFGFQCVGIYFLMVRSAGLAFVTLSLGAGLGILSIFGHMGLLDNRGRA